MLQMLFVSVLLFITPFSQASATDAKDQADTSAGAATTQPAAAGITAAEGASDPFATETLGQILGKTRVGKLFEGKTRVTGVPSPNLRPSRMVNV